MKKRKLKELKKLKERMAQCLNLWEANIFSNFNVLDAELYEYYQELFFIPSYLSFSEKNMSLLFF